LSHHLIDERSGQSGARSTYDEVEVSDRQIVSILEEAEAGQPVKENGRKYWISSACYDNWKPKFGGLSV
jgi:hypothetical protein